MEKVEPIHKLSLSKWINTSITILLMVGVGFLPPIGTITPYGMKVVGIFLGAVYGWSTVSIAWPSFLAMVLLAFSGAMPFNTVIVSGFGTQIVFLMILMFIVVAILDEKGVTRFLSAWVASRKILEGRPWLFSFAILWGNAVIGGAGGGFASLIVFFGIIANIAERFHYQPYSRYPTLMMIGLCFSSLLGSTLFLFTGNPLILMGAYQELTGYQANGLIYTSYALIITTLALICYIFICKYVLKPDVRALKAIDNTVVNANDLVLKKDQKCTLIFFAAMLITLLLPGALPQSSTVKALLSGLTPAGCVAFWLVIMLIIRIDGQPLFNLQKAASQGIIWDTVWISCVVLPMSGLLTSDAVGFKALLVSLLEPILSGRSTIIFVVLVLLFSTIMTQFATNTIIGLIFIPIIYSFSVTMSFNAVPILVLMLISIHLAVLTPAASPWAALLFGNMQWLKPGDIYKYGIIFTLILLVLLTLIGYPLATIMFK